MRATARVVVAALVLSMAGVMSAAAHRQPGTGGRVWVVESRPRSGFLVVRGGIRQVNRTDADLAMRCRIRVTTTEGRTGATWRRMVIEEGSAVVKKWRVLIKNSDPDARASEVHVRHCHELD